MIPNNVRVATVTGDLGPVEHKRMEVDADGMAHIMALLTKLYSDEEMACIREYSTNALDAQFDAGYTGPIEVTTPTSLSPFLRIKDHGVGMDKATFTDLYSQYGKSTKRAQKETNGSMGIGCKSALAYTTQFSVVGVKNGVKTTASISIDEDGVGDIQIIDESKTDESNGVEVIIPAKRYNEFEEKAEKFFQFWKRGTVLLNGKDPVKDFEKMTDRIYLHDGPEDVVVMGNVAYPVDDAYAISKAGRNVACFVTMNTADEVVFTPSREGLIYNGITKNALMGLREEYQAHIREHVERSIANAPNHYEAWLLAKKFASEFGAPIVKDVKYNGDEMHSGYIMVTRNGVENKFRATFWNPQRHRNSVNGNVEVSLDSIQSSSMVITGYKGSGVSSVNKSKIKQYAVENGIAIGGGGYYGKSIILVSEDVLPGAPWTTYVKTHSWKSILAATKAERTANAGGGFSYDGRYDVWDADSDTFEVTDVPVTAKILFYSPKDCNPSGTFLNRIVEADPDVVIVSANANRHGKLQRLYPNSKQLRIGEWNVIFAKQDFDALSQDDLDTLRFQTLYSEGYWEKNYMVNVHAAFKMVDKIDDPEYADALRRFHKPVKVGQYLSFSKEYNDLLRQWNRDKASVPIRFAKRYPLMNWEKQSLATVEYINMMYANKKGN
jgi:hypothetical protein